MRNVAANHVALATTWPFFYLWLMIRKRGEVAVKHQVERTGRSWLDFPWAVSIVGGVLLFGAFPPIDFDWCGWVAPIPWLLLVRTSGQPPRRFYWKLWVASCMVWMAMIWGITLAHPANILGWLALSLYLAVYLPAFVAITRQAVHVGRVPLMLAAPVVWTGLELLRGYLFTGFSMALLGHTQVDHVALIQVSDITGAYGVSFLVMLGASCCLELAPGIRKTRRWVPAAVLLVAIGSALSYGFLRLRSTPLPSNDPLRVALLQGTRDKVFEFNEELDRKAFEQYRSLMKRARDSHSNLDLIVWPESAFTGTMPELLVQGDLEAPARIGMSTEEYRSRVAGAQHAFAAKTRSIAAEANLVVRGSEVLNNQTKLVVGVGTSEFHGQLRDDRNTALLIDETGEIQGRYYKTHPVMFGEYVPFGRLLPWLYSLTPMQQGLTPGETSAAFEVKGYHLVPSVCFESSVPHVIRRHVRQLRSQGQQTDFLVNVTDDGWFWGSAILDFQFIGGIFRAVELRMPFIVAANTGITAAIDGNGRVLSQLPRRHEGIVAAEIHRDGRFSFYERFGDVFGCACLLASSWWAFGLRRRKTKNLESHEN